MSPLPAASDPPSVPHEGPAEQAWIDPALPVAWQGASGRQEQEPAPEWTWSLRALLSAQYIDYGTPNRKDQDLETENASVVLQLRHGDDLRLWIEPDAEGEHTPDNLRELWAEWALAPRTWLTVGQFRLALGSEFATRAEDLPLVGHSYTSWLDGRYATGARLDGYPAEHLWYELTATVDHGFDLDGERRDVGMLALRSVVTARPRLGRPFEGFFGGVALAVADGGDDQILLQTPARQTTFTSSELDGDEAVYLHWELGYRGGPFRFGLESVDGAVSDVPVGGGQTEDFDQLGAWSAFVAWNFKGDAPVWERGRWRPYSRQDRRDGKAPPVEFAFRYSNADMDRSLYDYGFASYATSSQETRTLSAAISTWLGTDTRLTVEWVGVIADQELPDFDDDNRARNWILRWDQWFGR